MSAPLTDAMVMMREIFTSLVSAGFTEYQACVILGSWFAAQAQSAQSGE